MNRLTSLFIATLIGVVFLAGTAEGRFTVSPTEIHLEVADGGRGGMPVKITNTGEKTITLKLSFGDSRFLPDGTEEEILVGGHPRSCAGWVLLSEQLLELKPGESEEIPIILEVPAGARGSFWSKLAVEEIAGPIPGSDSRGTRSHRTLTPQRIGIRIFESVPGTTHRLAKIEDVMVRSITTEEFPVVHMQVKNVGNSLLHCRGWVELLDSDGAAVDTLRAGKTGRFTLFPDGYRILEATARRPLRPGNYTALAIIDLGGDHLMAGDASFVVRMPHTPFIAETNNPDMLDLLVEPVNAWEEPAVQPSPIDLTAVAQNDSPEPAGEKIEVAELLPSPDVDFPAPTDGSEEPFDSGVEPEETPETAIPPDAIPETDEALPLPPVETGETFTVQLKAASSERGASDFIEAVNSAFDQELYVLYEKPYYKVRAGRYRSQDEAGFMLARAKEFGFDQAWIAKVRDPSAAPLPVSDRAEPVIASISEIAGAAPDGMDRPVPVETEKTGFSAELEAVVRGPVPDESREIEPARAPIAKPGMPVQQEAEGEAGRAVAALEAEEIMPETAPEPEMVAAPPAPGIQGWRVQVLSTRDLHAAEKLALEMMRKYEVPVRIDETPPYFAVRLGAFIDRDSAVLLMHKLITSGNDDVLIVECRIRTGR